MHRHHREHAVDWSVAVSRTIEGVGRVRLSRALRRLGTPPSLKNIKYTRMRHTKRQNSKIFLLPPEGPRDNVVPELRCFDEQLPPASSVSTPS